MGSALLHLALFVMMAKMSPSTHVSMREFEAFMIELPVARLAETHQSAPHGSGTGTHRNSLKSAQFQPMRLVGKSVPPLTVQNAKKIEAYPTIDPTDMPSQLAQSADSVKTASDTAPISPLSSRSQGDDSGNNPPLSSSRSSGSGQVMVLGEVGSPRFIHKELPAYPFMACKLGKEGKVVLKLALDAQGQIEKIDIVAGSRFGFTEAAIDAIRKSTFAPAVKNGRPISSHVLVPIRFILRED
jgi:protein TonB